MLLLLLLLLPLPLLRPGGAVEKLHEIHLRCSEWAGSRNAGRAIGFADGRSGSVGESRGRVLVDAVGLPAPQTQVTILDEGETFVGVVDLLLRGQTILEFDGRMKYGLDGLTPVAVAERVWSEKIREDLLRRLGYEPERFVWADLYRPSEITTRALAAIGRAAMSVRSRSFQAPFDRPRSGDPSARSSRRCCCARKTRVHRDQRRRAGILLPALAPAPAPAPPM